MVLITGENGAVTGVEKVTPNNLELARRAELMQPEAAPTVTVGSIGTPGNGLCTANHKHLYTDDWKKDADYQAAHNDYEAARLKIQQYIEEQTHNFFVLATEFMTNLGKVVSLLLIGSIPLAAGFINFIISILNTLYDLGIDEIDVGGVERKTEELIEELNQIYFPE